MWAGNFDKFYKIGQNQKNVFLFFRTEISTKGVVTKSYFGRHKP